MYRHKMSKRHSRRSFQRGVSRVHHKNVGSHSPNPGMRGGRRG